MKTIQKQGIWGKADKSNYVLWNLCTLGYYSPSLPFFLPSDQLSSSLLASDWRQNSQSEITYSNSLNSSYYGTL